MRGGSTRVTHALSRLQVQYCQDGMNGFSSVTQTCPVNCNTGEKVLIFILFFNCSHISLCFGLSSKIGQVACESLSTWMWELDYKKAECWRIDVFELWFWRRLLRVPWTSRRSNQSIRKEISPVCSLEGLMLKLKLQYFGHLMRGAESLEKILMLRKIEGRRRRDNRGCDGWMASLTQWTWVWINSGSWWWTGRPGMLQSMGSQIVRHDWVTELRGRWSHNILWNKMQISLCK